MRSSRRTDIARTSRSPGGASSTTAPLAVRGAVVVLAGLLVASLGGLVVLHLRPALRPGSLPAPAIVHPRAHARRARARPTTTTAPLLTSAGAPSITTLTPASGPTGQLVTVTGSGLFSADGSIVVTFGGRVSTTRCPTEQRCVAVAPSPPSGATSVNVQLRTSSGVSNALVFHYA